MRADIQKYDARASTVWLSHNCIYTGAQGLITIAKRYLLLLLYWAKNKETSLKMHLYSSYGIFMLARKLLAHPHCALVWWWCGGSTHHQTHNN